MIKIKNTNHEVDWHAIRQCVFVIEQGFQNEFDAIDSVAHHVVLYVDDKAVGCGRTYAQNKRTSWHLGRLAIIKEYRKTGYGADIMKQLEAYAHSQGGTQMILSAQLHAIPFYQKQGYESYGEQYLVEHVLHQNMRKKI